ncbi:cilia- and flagella-associated protein 47-like [Parambassis ranga]|uniref:Cilia- and flagella-associated protein 47-like n=1 Tax=Parambassis ranga TaxID=210632 RepID=A0A6P7JGC2_9TELE|nr:cilia- and flagella-associated protein 47 [Parambassis ranga]
MAGSCVRVDPPCVEFTDVRVGQVYKVTLTAVNSGKNSKKIVFETPTSKVFKFKEWTQQRPVVLAPGQCIRSQLEFTPVKEEEVRDHLLIHIDDSETMKIPLLGFPRVCSLFMDSVLDFGCIVASSQVISKHHPITNQGSAPGVFQMQYSGDPSLSISPSSGVVAAGSTQWLKVELCTDRPRLIDEKALVKLRNRPAVVLSIRAEVVDQHLEVFDMQGNPLSCLWFGPMYFGTSCLQNVVLRNNSPQACDWVCVLQDTAAGTEVGTDLQKSTDAALLEGMQRCSPVTQDASKIVACVPKQGRLGPYDKTTVAVRFSPICKRNPSVLISSVTERRKRDDRVSQQDYCLFLLFESVGSKHGFTRHNADSSVELAVTGSGLPVYLVPSPSQRFNFHSCVMGQRVELLCVLQNFCPLLPVRFCFRKLAHFHTKPSSGTIAPGQCQDVVLSFKAQQQGSFHMCQIVDVLGHVVCQRNEEDTTEDVTELELCSFHTITLHLSAVCHSETTHTRSKLNPAAVQVLAPLNNEAFRMRPATSHPDYALTEEDKKLRRQHRQIYTDFIKQLKQTCRQKIKERQQEKLEGSIDIGIVPSHGLVPPTLCISDLEVSEPKLDPSYTYPEKKCKASLKQNTSSQVSEVMDAVPSSSQEVADCNRSLTAQEFYQVVIGPLSVDFGRVCVDSVCVQKLELVNHLSAYVRVQLEVDHPELQGTSPLSFVLPPHSHNTSPLTFQSSKLGPFYGPVSYSVNQRHQRPGQILVQAQVVPFALELSTNLLVIHPIPSLVSASGYRSSVTLRNHCNHAAEFTWRPVVTENGILFSVRPAKGVVEPHRDLDCEVVWHPSFSSPSEGDFDLCVLKGNIQRLHCVAKVGPTSVHLAENRVVFGSVPLNMPSIRTAVLHNTGQNHAYYQVSDVCPLPGMVVNPPSGVVPSRGHAVLRIHFTPDCAIKFDTRVKIALRKMKAIELRVGGCVEPPNIDFSVSRFQFNGVHVGSQRAIPFSVTNCSSAVARVTIDLSEYKDFSVHLSEPSAKRVPGVSVMEVQGCQTVKCSLVFVPTQIATYEFDLPLTVNGVRCPPAPLSPSLSPSSSPTSSSYSVAAGSMKHTVKPLSYWVPMATQQPCIEATVLSAPLEMSPLSLQFHVGPQSDTYIKKVQLKAACEESPCWRGDIGDRVHWWFDCSAAAAGQARDREERPICVVSPSSGSLGPSQSICLVVSIRPEAFRTGSVKVTRLSLPLYLRDIGADQPYRELSVTVSVTLQLPSITAHPAQILLTPVPLQTTTETTVTLLAAGYPSGTCVSAEVDELQLEDGTKIQPFSLIFPEGSTIPAQDHDQEACAASLPCSVSFCSTVPLSVCTAITLTDHLHNRFQIRLCASADSCLLTAWPYMALHQSEQHIVLKTGTTAVEAVLQRCHTSSPAASVLSSSSSSFEHNSSSNRNSDSFSDSDSVGREASGDTDNHPSRDTLPSLGVPEFLVANTDEGLYHQTVLLAVERWFSLFGWPGGPHPITVPHTLRRVVEKIQTDQSSGRTYRVSQNTDSRAVMDMLHHLTGRQIPGIPHCQTFSSDTAERTNQLLQQHEAMLAFLRLQGASLCHIRPEYLLDVTEFKHWCSLQSDNLPPALNYSHIDYESLSKRSWTDVLLQMYKVLVLPRVSESDLSTPVMHSHTDEILPISSQPLTSNIYSPWELHLLSWLNRNYQKMRETAFGAGGAPSARWIVNFDLDLTDGLVLAALLAAHCPYLIESHFQRMYTTTNSLEQSLHNNIIVAQVLTTLGLNINVQPTDLTDPNAVQMLILCVHLHERLPEYLPVHTITLSGSLHHTFSKQVNLKNPSSQCVKYQALLLGKGAPLFSLPDGSTVTIPPKSSSIVTVQFGCSFLRPMEAVLLLVSSSASGLHCSALAFNLKTHVSHITPTNTVECKTQCYQLKEIQVPLVNTFNKEAKFRVVLVESTYNPLKPDTKKDRLVQLASSTASMKTSDMISQEEIENVEDGEFVSAVRSVSLKSGQADTLSIHYLPFYPRTKHCSVLLISPQVGDMVYMVKATSELPLPSPLTARPSSNIVSIANNSDTSVCAPVLRLQCAVGQVCEEVLHIPRINNLWERALATWGQQHMSASERRRRILTHTLHSSTVRAATAAQKLFSQKAELPSKEVEYSVEVSLPKYFTLPSSVKIPVEEDSHLPWEDPADFGCVDVPLHFQADSVGQFTCEVLLRSWCDTRVYMLEALVTSQRESIYLNFSSPAHRSVTQHIPLHNETRQDWKMQAEVCGEGFSGPDVLDVPAGTKTFYPLTFHPAAPYTVMGKLSLHNNCDGTEHLFTLRGVGENPLPVDHVVLHCPVGKTTHTQLDVPNYSQHKLTLEVVTDLSVVSGTPSLEIKPCRSAPYILAVSPWKRGKQTGCVSFVESDDVQEHKGSAFKSYEVTFSLEIICEPAAPVKVINVQCAAQSSVAIEIPVSNPGGGLLMLDVCLEGDDLSGPDQVSVPPRETLAYKTTFSPSRVGKNTGSVLFHSELVGEFWYQLELYALPPPVSALPQACCQLGKWTGLNIPLVNPTAEALELIVANSNLRNFALQLDSSNTLTIEPHSSHQLGVHFTPSSIGEGNHRAKITFTCPEFQEWCVLLSGRGLKPERQEPVSVSSVIGSSTSVSIPFRNPTDFPATLSIALTDMEPSGASICRAVTELKGFSVPLSRTDGVQIGERETFDVPVLFAPTSVELQRAWLCITMKPTNNRSLGDNSNSEDTCFRPEQESSAICWIHPLCGIPTEVPVGGSLLGVVRCEVGCRSEKKVDVQLSGCVPGTKDRTGQEVTWVDTEDFLCEVRSDSEAKHSLSVSIESARRDPHNGIVTLTLHLAYAPLRTSSSSGVLAVQSVCGKMWEFPFRVAATEPQVDDVILTESTPVGTSSAVGFRLTSTTRRSEPFTAAFLPGSSSSEFSVTPVSGVLPPAGSAGAHITVFFTPSSSSKTHTAKLSIQAADMRWVYEVRGKTPHGSAHTFSTSDSSSGPPKERQKNFVVQNLQLPSLANSSPLKLHR